MGFHSQRDIAWQQRSKSSDAKPSSVVCRNLQRLGSQSGCGGERTRQERARAEQAIVGERTRADVLRDRLDAETQARRDAEDAANQVRADARAAQDDAAALRQADDARRGACGAFWRRGGGNSVTPVWGSPPARTYSTGPTPPVPRINGRGRSSWPWEQP